CPCICSQNSFGSGASAAPRSPYSRCTSKESSDFRISAMASGHPPMLVPTGKIAMALMPYPRARPAVRKDTNHNGEPSASRGAARESQWGRARMSAEMTIPRVVPTAGIVASMGPRSDERGNQPMQLSASGSFKLQWGRARMSAEICGSCAVAATASKLQWGRARMSAEIQSKLHAGNGQFELQWGRARMSAEIDGMTPAEVEREIASMGPRSDERGNELLVLDHRKDFAE